ncbi:amidohydrolase family protein [Sinomicrobium kalidii]|uniref:amidohydrolase family protein n=1 Tax=Sinomicrobium kalidii TaxID=2900738 RepID=UPI001E287040|nr:amidohydrolase family protein [Sinomicrobium kalidii]UGU16602.1 amidohydrolase family protein [Sinomicrobium kalidii]
MFIDAHQHFWQYDPERDAWIDDTMKVIRRDFMPSDLKPVLEANEMDGCVAVQADQSEDETEFLLECAARNPFVKAVVGWADLRAENVAESLARFSENLLFKGVRHIVQGEADDFMLRQGFRKGIGALEPFGLTYDILVYARQLPAAVDLVRKFPRQRFVLDHIAKPEISGRPDPEWTKNIRELAKSENVYCKLSGMVTETDNFSWKQEDFTPFLDIVTEAFGTDRLMFGSDWPVCLVAAEYKEVLKIVREYFSQSELPEIMGQNAMQFYGISAISE